MANYLWKNRHGQYYFRVRIPVRYSAEFGDLKELRSPLKTSDKVIAKRFARGHMFALDKLLSELDEMRRRKSKQPSLSLNYELTTETEELPSGAVRTSTKLSISPEESKELGIDFVKQLVASFHASENPQHIDNLSTKNLPATNSESLIALSDKYIACNNWRTPITAKQYKGTFSLLLNYFGNRKLNQIKKSETSDFVEILKKLPRNLNGAKSTFQNTPIRQVAAEYTGQTIAPKTVRDHVVRINAFYRWAANNSDEPIESPFKGIKLKRNLAESAREAFDPESIHKIFTCYLYGKNEWPKRKSKGEPSKYWISLILAYTGCRLNEACQLYLDDVYLDSENILTFDFNSKRSDQSIKSGIWRKVPAHPILKKSGLEGYIESLRSEGHSRLFPELTFSQNGEGYARAIGEFCRELYKSVGAIGTPHNFRHTVVKQLRHSGVPREILRSIVGHYDNTTLDTTDRYGGGELYTSKQKLDAIKKISYEFEDTLTTFEQFRKRAPKRKL